MKKGLLCLLACMCPLLGQPVVTVEPVAPSLSGITLIKPVDSNFQSLVATFVPASEMPAFAPFLPYSVIVRNSTPRNILGMSVVFRVVNQQGQPFTMAISPANFPTMRRPVLAPGKTFFVPVESPGRTDSSVGLTASASLGIEQYNSSRSIDISVDSVLFDDGTLAGPDTLNMFDHYSARLLAFKTIAQNIISYKDPLPLKGYLDGITLTRDQARELRKTGGLQAETKIEMSVLAIRVAQQLDRKSIDPLIRNEMAVLEDVGKMSVHK